MLCGYKFSHMGGWDLYARGLSRIEKGSREPSHAKFVAMMQRLGQWEDSYDLFVGDAYYEIAEMQNEI